MISAVDATRSGLKPAQNRRQSLLRFILAALLFAGSVCAAAGQTAADPDSAADKAETGAEENAGTFSIGTLRPDVYCFSGSPLLLQVNVPVHGQPLESISIESAASSFLYSFPEAPESGELQLYVNPFLSPGVFELEIALQTRSGEVSRSRFNVGFVDFVWGRDNLNFGNNSKYVSVIGTFGEVLAEWLGARFGDLEEPDVILLVDYMYGLFGRNTGRCYAFSGMEVRYWRWPELLPSYYESIHEIRGSVAGYQREMNFLQFDIVFDHFLAGPGNRQILSAMNRGQMEAQAAEIERRIAAGVPVAVGFAGPEIHHSMLVFGFIRNHNTHTVDLLVANNWKNDEKLNIHSRDAEIIRLFLDPELPAPAVQWLYEEGVRKSEIDRLFVVDVRRDTYEHEQALLDTLVENLKDQLYTDGRTVVVVEDADGARVMDGELSSGWMRNRITEEIDGVWFEHVGEAFRFTCPAEKALELEIVHSGRARVLSVSPASEPGVFVTSIYESDTSETGETVTRRFPLPVYPAVTGAAGPANAPETR